jgi:hypothetical protein
MTAGMFRTHFFPDEFLAHVALSDSLCEQSNGRSGRAARKTTRVEGQDRGEDGDNIASPTVKPSTVSCRDHLVVHIEERICLRSRYSMVNI